MTALHALYLTCKISLKDQIFAVAYPLDSTKDHLAQQQNPHDHYKDPPYPHHLTPPYHPVDPHICPQFYRTPTGQIAALNKGYTIFTSKKKGEIFRSVTIQL